MAPTAPQNFLNHARYVPLFHFVLGALFLANFVVAVRGSFVHLSTRSVMDALMGFAFLVLWFYTRNFALAAQDRVIRLEMRLRMQALAPELMPRFGQLAPHQLTALRFAGDGELPALAREVLDGRLTRNGEIKRRIQDWQADTMRV